MTWPWIMLAVVCLLFVTNSYAAVDLLKHGSKLGYLNLIASVSLIISAVLLLELLLR